MTPDSQNSQVDVFIVGGAGRYGTNYPARCTDADNAPLVHSVTIIDPARGQNTNAQHVVIPQRFEDVGPEIFDTGDNPQVFILTGPNHTHLEHLTRTLRLSNRVKGILVEKPVIPRIDAVAELKMRLGEADERGIGVTTGLVHQFDARLVEFLNIISKCKKDHGPITEIIRLVESKNPGKENALLDHLAHELGVVMRVAQLDNAVDITRARKQKNSKTGYRVTGSIGDILFTTGIDKEMSRSVEKLRVTFKDNHWIELVIAGNDVGTVNEKGHEARSTIATSSPSERLGALVRNLLNHALNSKENPLIINRDMFLATAIYPVHLTRKK